MLKKLFNLLQPESELEKMLREIKEKGGVISPGEWQKINILREQEEEKNKRNATRSGKKK